MFIIQCPILWYAKVCALPRAHSSCCCYSCFSLYYFIIIITTIHFMLDKSETGKSYFDFDSYDVFPSDAPSGAIPFYIMNAWKGVWAWSSSNDHTSGALGSYVMSFISIQSISWRRPRYICHVIYVHTKHLFLPHRQLVVEQNVHRGLESRWIGREGNQLVWKDE